jgi:hypothetical protein
MRKLIASEFVSLNGVMRAPGGKNEAGVEAIRNGTKLLEERYTVATPGGQR